MSLRGILVALPARIGTQRLKTPQDIAAKDWLK
jgi:hypothetical protein